MVACDVTYSGAITARMRGHCQHVVRLARTLRWLCTYHHDHHALQTMHYRPCTTYTLIFARMSCNWHSVLPTPHQNASQAGVICHDWCKRIASAACHSERIWRVACVEDIVEQKFLFCFSVLSTYWGFTVVPYLRRRRGRKRLGALLHIWLSVW